MTWTVHCADVLDWCEKYKGEPFHAILCDPSYGLGNHPDIEALLTAWLNSEDYDTGPGFMSKDWDRLPGPRIWRALRRVCHPGAYLFAFGGTRTADLLSVAIRLGGWERFDEIDSLSWVYGSGFPKSHNISRALNKVAGVKGEMELRSIAYPDSECWSVPNKNSTGASKNPSSYGDMGLEKIAAGNGMRRHEKPATPLAATWEGYGTALKPAHEPILCFRNPKQGTYAQNCVSTGAGALNIDGCRVGVNGNEPNKRRATGQYGNPSRRFDGDFPVNHERPATLTNGRWPPNVLLSHVAPSEHTPGCRRLGVKRVRGANHPGQAEGTKHDGKVGGVTFQGRGNLNTYVSPDGLESVTAWACALACSECGHQWAAEQRGACPECGGESAWICPVGAIGEQSGEKVSRWGKHNGQHPDSMFWGNGETKTDNIAGRCEKFIGDKGTAARFYPQFAWQAEVAERLALAEPFRYQAKSSRRERDSGLEELPLRERSTQGRDIVRVIDRKDGKGPVPVNAQIRPARNHHPCIKPIELCKWLATLLAPPPEYAPRRLLVPFCGSGSEMIGALLTGQWEDVVGVEQSAEYVAIAEARLAHWLKEMQLELML